MFLILKIGKKNISFAHEDIKIFFYWCYFHYCYIIIEDRSQNWSQDGSVSYVLQKFRMRNSPSL